ncbi:valine--tRNA ligase [Candidatus Omnitrophota bacterium]
MSELSSRFNFKEIDEKWSTKWEDSNIFHGKKSDTKQPYSIVIPPPNVTGILHMGHALNNTLQDIIIRYKRMSGFETCWMPGTDHAGIATQNVVEKKLAKEGKTRQDVGREALIEQLWEWKKEYGNTIIHQLKKLGSSCDWQRTRFTMDDDYSDAVKKVFVSLYNKDLIYKGERIINWCPRCHTALSDEEAEHEDHNGHLYHIQYPFKDDPTKHVIVATTRPETMLGDTAVAVHPDDERYKDLIGKTLILPIVEREIQIIADDFVDPTFGTGAVKVTPAHDPNDFEMGKRHDLEFINVMHPDGRINKMGGLFNDMDRFDARKKIIEILQKDNLLVNIDDHAHAVGHCYRCHTIVEPYLSKQWFVKMKPLAEPALKVVAEGKVTFHPERWTKVYNNWLENIRDWCISRQIWWGHRIPVWYCQDCDPTDNIIVSETTPSTCPKCQSQDLIQDEDVLDTWFSSWLWPFATFEWPNDNEDLKFFYPTASLFTAPEIIFFWVARMIMAGIEFMGDVPFKDVYLHGTVRDAKGRKMSKSLGNALDPLEIIEEYGADALRFSLIMNSGQDLYISKEKFEIGRNFANKIWNASRLIMMNTTARDPNFSIDTADKEAWDLPTQWIVSQFYTTAEKTGNAIENFRYSEAESLIYEFFWSNFCDWYLEIIKNRWDDTNIQNVVYFILTESLKIIHPFMPFVTEELWETCVAPDAMCCVQPWPAIKKDLINSNTEANMQLLINVVTSIRNIRAEWNIKSSDHIEAFFTTSSDEVAAVLNNNKETLENLARLNARINETCTTESNVATAVIDNIKCVVPLGDLIDIDAEKKKLTAQLESQKKALMGLSKRLSNESFLAKAPEDVVAKEKEREAQLISKNKELEAVLHGLK